MRKVLSPSRLSLFLECPRCFWLEVHGKKRPKGIFPSLPSGMDKVLKNYFDKCREDGTIPEEIKELGADLFKDMELLNTWRNNRRGIQWIENDFTLMGAVDDILIRNKKLIVLDFKTRGFPLKEDTHLTYTNQLSLYVFLLRKNEYKVEDKAYLLFYHPEQANGRKVDFNIDLVEMDTDVKKAEKIFKDAVKCLLRKEPKKDTECEWCNWKD